MLDGRRTLAATFVVAGALFCIGLAFRRSISGLGLSAELEQGCAQLLFLATFAFPSVAPRILSMTLPERVTCTRNLTHAFAAIYAAFLFTTALQGALESDLAPMMTLVFPSVNAVITGVLIMTMRADENARLMRDRAGRTLYILALFYFWAFFAIVDFARIGRSRLTDPFFTATFALLIAALVLRLADRWTLRRRVAGKVG